MTSQAEPSSNPLSSKNTNRLIVLCVLAGLFNAAMMALAIAEFRFSRQGFLLLPVLLIGGPALLLQLGVLVPLVLYHVFRNRGQQAEVPRTALIVVLCAAIAPGAGTHAWLLYDYVQGIAAATENNTFYASGLHDAVNRRNVQRAEDILQTKNSDPSGRDFFGNTPLILATKNSDKAMVAMLLYRGANPNGTDQDDRTPLSWAAESGNLDIACLLLQHGAAVNEGDHSKKTPLAYAQAARQIEMVALLQSKGGTPTDISRQVFEAFRFGRMDEFRSLIEAGFDVNYKHPNGTGLLHEVVEKGDRQTVDYLLSKGADVNANCYFGTPLHSAANEGRVDMIRLLVAKGAKVDTVSVSGKTALDYAQENGHQEAVKVLRELGATR